MSSIAIPSQRSGCWYRTPVAAISLAIASGLITHSSYAQSYTIDAADRGWYTNTGFHSPNLHGTVQNYIAGNYGSPWGSEFRNWFVFDVEEVNGEIEEAYLRLYMPGGSHSGYSSSSASEIYTVFDVDTPADELVAGGRGLVDTFDDLGAGTTFGQQTVSSDDNGGFVAVPLNPNFVAAAEETSGLLAIGGAITTLDNFTSTREVAFAWTQANLGRSLRETQLVLTPKFESIELAGNGGVYAESFDGLGADSSVDEQLLPVGWLAKHDGMNYIDTTSDSFPVNRVTSRFNPILNAGGEGSTERSLAMALSTRREATPAIQLVAEVVDSAASSFQLEFAVEAWDAGTRNSTPDVGEAAFEVSLEVDHGSGFELLSDLGTVTTGRVLQRPNGDYIDGNLDGNRTTHNSGRIEQAIPEGARIRLRWKAGEDATEGWVFGLDDVQLSLFGDAASIFGDFDRSGAFDAADIDLLSAAVRDDIDDLIFDTNGDGRVGAADYDSLLDQANVLFGDADTNNEVDFSDFLALSNNFGEAGGWAEGDFDGSGVVDFPDFLVLSENFGTTAVAVAVPEPGSTWLCLMGLIGLSTWRRRGHLNSIA